MNWRIGSCFQFIFRRQNQIFGCSFVNLEKGAHRCARHRFRAFFGAFLALLKALIFHIGTKFKTGPILICLCFFGLIYRAEAYSIFTHNTLTHRAVDEYEICRKLTDLGAPLPPDADKILSRSNIYEDIAVWLKAFNWHFYHLGMDLGPAFFGLGHGSMQWRFQELEKDVLQRHSLNSLGGLIHYIQDVTNPAHVAPVFHFLGDSFDNFDFSEAFSKTISESECRELASQGASIQTYSQILEITSLNTLSNMNKSFQYSDHGQFYTIRWKDAFWKSALNTEKTAFGHYGDFGNNFGSTKIGNIYIDPRVYALFASQQIRSALNASILVMTKYSKNF